MGRCAPLPPRTPGGRGQRARDRRRRARSARQVGDGAPALLDLCTAVEAVFMHGLKDGRTFMGDGKGCACGRARGGGPWARLTARVCGRYWGFLADSMEQSSIVLREVLAMPQNRTALGRGARRPRPSSIRPRR